MGAYDSAEVKPEQNLDLPEQSEENLVQEDKDTTLKESSAKHAIKKRRGKKSGKVTNTSRTKDPSKLEEVKTEEVVPRKLLIHPENPLPSSMTNFTPSYILKLKEDFES
jgi:hypothetical protein